MSFITENTYPRAKYGSVYVPIPIRHVDASTVKVGDKVLLCHYGYVIGSISSGSDWWTVEKVGRKWVWLGRVLGSGALDSGWKVPLKHNPDVSCRELATYVKGYSPIG